MNKYNVDYKNLGDIKKFSQGVIRAAECAGLNLQSASSGRGQYPRDKACQGTFPSYLRSVVRIIRRPFVTMSFKPGDSPAQGINQCFLRNKQLFALFTHNWDIIIELFHTCRLVEMSNDYLIGQ